ncbi:MAG: hypothetical protein WAU54_03905 [Chania sp.]
MRNLFLTAANAIVAKFDQRMETRTPEYATATMLTAVEHLRNLASIAWYTGDSATAEKLNSAAYAWEFHGLKPREFKEAVSDA